MVLTASAAFLVLMIWRMRQMSLRAQFLVLLALGVSVGFVLLTVVQVPRFSGWLATLLVAMVFVAAPFATRTFMRSLKQEEQDEEGDRKDETTGLK